MIRRTITHAWECDIEGCDGCFERPVTVAPGQPEPNADAEPPGWVAVRQNHFCPAHQVHVVVSDAAREVRVRVNGDPQALVFVLPPERDAAPPPLAELREAYSNAGWRELPSPDGSLSFAKTPAS
jgi:hypothetical protein